MNKEEEINFRKYDTVLVAIKPTFQTLGKKQPDLYLRGILINTAFRVNHKNDYNHTDVKLYLSSNQCISNNHFEKNGKIHSSCKMLPCRIVLIEKTFDWNNFENLKDKGPFDDNDDEN